MRVYHDQALIDEFQRRGINTTSVFNGKAISLGTTCHHYSFTIKSFSLTK